MANRRTLLIVSGGAEAIAGIRRARELGLHVVVSDGNPSAPGFVEADDRMVASTYDVEGTVQAARRYNQDVRPIDGVICIAADIPLTVASVAEALGLPGIPVAAARLSQDKLAMKDRFGADGVAVPWYAPVSTAAELAAIQTARGELLVVKPVDSRGARGVTVLQPGDHAVWAWEWARRFSPSGRVMVERFLHGPQLSTESLVLDGVAHTPGMADRNYARLAQFAPHVIEDGGDLPTILDAAARGEVVELIQAAARSMGIRNGVVKGDVVLHEGRATIIEVAARLSGGYFCTHEVPRSTGVDLVGAAIRVALGEPVDSSELTVKGETPVCQRWLFPPQGEVLSVDGVDAAAAMPGVFHLEVRVRPGDVVGPQDSHPARAGVVMTDGATRGEARERAEAALARVHIVTAPVAA